MGFLYYHYQCMAKCTVERWCSCRLQRNQTSANDQKCMFFISTNLHPFNNLIHNFHVLYFNTVLIQSIHLFDRQVSIQIPAQAYNLSSLWQFNQATLYLYSMTSSLIYYEIVTIVKLKSRCTQSYQHFKQTGIHLS